MDLKSDEEVRQQCDTMGIDEALEITDELGGEPYSRRSEALIVLCAEVRRLRDGEEASRALATSAHAARVKLESKLARVAALPKAWRLEESHRTNDEEPLLSGLDCATYLDDALRDEPVTPPSKAEPYNGY